MPPKIALRPFTGRDLQTVEHWFDDPDTRRWLGGPEWPRESLALCGERRLMFLAFLENNPVCLIDLELETGAQASFALAVAPGYRRRGIAAATIKTLLHHGVLAETTELYGGVAQGNLASEALVRKTGFRPRGERDADGFQDFCLRTK